MAEVLAVEADDEGRHEQHRGDHRQPLHHLVLVVGDLRLVVVARAREQVAREVEPVYGAQQFVVDVGEVELDVAREDLLALADVDPAVDHAPDRVARRRHRAPHVQQVVAQLRDAAADLVRRPALDSVLELVDLVVDRVHEVEEVLGDQVDDPVDHQADGWLLLALDRRLRRRDVERVPVLGGLPHGHELLARRDHVDLLVEDAILLADADRHEEDPEDVVVVALQPRARLVVMARRSQQLLERAFVDLAPERRSKLGLRGVEQVDPLGHAPRLAAASVGASPRGEPRARWPGGPREPRASARSRARPSRRCRQR